MQVSSIMQPQTLMQILKCRPDIICNEIPDVTRLHFETHSNAASQTLAAAELLWFAVQNITYSWLKIPKVLLPGRDVSHLGGSLPIVHKQNKCSPHTPAAASCGGAKFWLIQLRLSRESSSALCARRSPAPQRLICSRQRDTCAFSRPYCTELLHQAQLARLVRQRAQFMAPSPSCVRIVQSLVYRPSTKQ